MDLEEVMITSWNIEANEELVQDWSQGNSLKVVQGAALVACKGSANSEEQGLYRRASCRTGKLDFIFQILGLGS